MAQKEQGGYCHRAGETKDRKFVCQRDGSAVITVYSETHEWGLGLLLLNLRTVRTDFVTKMFVTCLWHKSLRRPGKMQKEMQNSCQTRSKCPGRGLQQPRMHLEPHKK